MATLWTAARQASLSLTISQRRLKLMSTASAVPLNHFILCRPLLICLQSFPASGSFPMSQLFASSGQKSFSISSSSEYSGLNSFKIDWFDLFAVQGTLNLLFQHHSLKASILWHSAFFTEKAIAPHSSTLAWKIPWMEEPGRLQSMGH